MKQLKKKKPIKGTFRNIKESNSRIFNDGTIWKNKNELKVRFEILRKVIVVFLTTAQFEKKKQLKVRFEI
jgi:hypothetical protein